MAIEASSSTAYGYYTSGRDTHTQIILRDVGLEWP